MKQQDKYSGLYFNTSRIPAGGGIAGVNHAAHLGGAAAGVGVGVDVGVGVSV